MSFRIIHEFDVPSWGRYCLGQEDSRVRIFVEEIGPLGDSRWQWPDTMPRMEAATIALGYELERCLRILGELDGQEKKAQEADRSTEEEPGEVEGKSLRLAEDFHDPDKE